MIVLAGPNGAGMSTLHAMHVDPHFHGPPLRQRRHHPARRIARRITRSSYKAAQIATERRDGLLAARADFVKETVFSHESKLDLIDHAKANGFHIVVLHVGVEDADICVARVNASGRRRWTRSARAQDPCALGA